MHSPLPALPATHSCAATAPQLRGGRTDSKAQHAVAAEVGDAGLHCIAVVLVPGVILEAHLPSGGEGGGY